MTKKSQTTKGGKTATSTKNPLIEQAIARARTMKPAARAEFLRRHTAAEIAEIHAALVGEAKPKTPRPILEKRILHALTENTPPPAHLDQDMNILVTEHHEAIAAATRDANAAEPTESKPLDEVVAIGSTIDATAGTGESALAGADDMPPAGTCEESATEAGADEEPPSKDAAATSADDVEGAPAGEPSANARAAASPSRTPRERDPRLPAVGTVIVKKDRNGTERVRCTIVEGGVEYSGTTYKSISSAAMAAAKDLGLASKTQDGYAFWGLKKATARTASTKDPVAGLQKAWDRYTERAASAAKAAEGEDRAKVHGALNEHITALTAIAAQVA